MVPVAAMADIAFLLIIFFMLTSNFIKEKDLMIKLATSSDIERLKPSLVSVVVDIQGNVLLQGQPCSTTMLESAVRALLAGKKQRIIMLKVDKDLPEQQFFPVLLAISDAEAQIALIGEKPSESSWTSADR